MAGKSTTWQVWCEMAKGSHNLAEAPWTALEFHEQTSLVFEWAERNEHCALLRRLVSFDDMKHPERLFQMHRYAVLGKVNEMRLFVDYDTNFNTERSYLSCALAPAARKGHLEIVQMLIAAGAYLEYSCPYERRNALQAAADSDNITMVRDLVTLGANVNAPADADPKSYNINYTRLIRGDYYGYNLDPNFKELHLFGQTALQAAVRAGHVNIVKYLLKAGADVNVAPSFSGNRTALQAAAENGSLEIVQILLQAGAIVNTAHKPGAPTALLAAARRGIPRPTALSSAGRNGHFAIVRQLLDAEAFIDSFGGKSPYHINWSDGDAGQLNPLQEAIRGGHSHIVRELLNNNANTNAVADGFGRTALQIAAEAGHLEIVRQLLDAKADVNATTKRPGKTLPPLHLANIGGHLEVVALLKFYGAN